MRRILALTLTALLFVACNKSQVANAPVQPAAPAPAVQAQVAQTLINAAVTDAARPATDIGVDSERKPAAMLLFAGVAPGQNVADLIPGGGYFTRLFSKVVGQTGHVYAIVPPSLPGLPPMAPPSPVDANVTVSVQDPTKLSTPKPLDMVWTSRNYHDMHVTAFHLDAAALNKAVFAALKPGGLFIVLDHASAAGSGLRDTDLLHRIDPALVRKEVEAAGFVFVEELNVLRNPNDDHTKKVFDAAIKGHTDQFVFKFKKPN